MKLPINLPFKALVISMVISFLPACEKSELGSTNDWPVIRAYVYSTDYINFNVSHQLPFNTEYSINYPPIDSILITISTADSSFTLTPTGEGNFIDSNLNLPINQNFTFSFDYNGKTISGTTHIPAKPEITYLSAKTLEVEKIEFGNGGFPPSGGPGDQPDPIEIKWNNPDASYFLLIVENMETDPEPIRELDEDATEDDLPDFSFRKQPTTSEYAEIRSNEFQYYGNHRIILFHVLNDYALLYDDVSTSSQNLSNPSTNINNAYGIFTGLNSDTVFVKIEKK